ncbi:MAG: NPCBM/NEW2 domain-containing protein [Bacteroidales bacterium]|nr:NPCBM/NEW2 domain-containing protein [Bacteroidales bacterium]MDD3384095.1 NPCBM/NEW2 domain-containing protein [Bacteroidales bacterium]MDD3871930.1 NPCBM/NEW2 domain-containing protein [Bacteroidales bacterium]NLO68244.1 alpha-galactosidase [Bacteroidales bacterium]
MKRLFSFRTLLFLTSTILLSLLSCSHHSEISLSSLDLSATKQGWGKVQIGKSITEKELRIAGTIYEEGVGTHANSTIRILLKKKPVRFTALVGMDDAALGTGGSVSFHIVGDDQLLWETSVVKPGDQAISVDLEIRGISELTLEVRDGGDGIDFDHANWVNARFSGRVDGITAWKPVIEKAEILTPKPGPKPRINGTRVWGVRPGNPVLFKIAATGDRPMSYEVKNLPDGLEVDSSTGIITGAVAEPGEYRMKFSVSNSLATAERDFKLVVGNTLALTPHMGWNSWYVWENHVTEQIMRDAADAMVETGMADHGYRYVNIDDCWSIKPSSDNPEINGEPRDAEGNLITNKRFPNMKGMVDYIHSKGLLAGTYTSPGPFTCAGHVSAYSFEEQDVKQFVEWEFDFLKYDWCSYGRIAADRSLAELQKPYQLISSILEQQPRDIVLNLCQYGMGEVWKWGRQVGGHSWRTAGDLGISFEGIGEALFRDGFDVYSEDSLHLYAGPGGWNDPDYLLFGYLSNWKGETAPTPLSPNEQYTQMSLWAIVAAPLIFSGDITRLDEFTLNVLTNDEIIEVNQDPLGKPGWRVAKEGFLEVWKRELEDGSIAVGLFNRGEEPAKVTATWEDLGITGKRVVRDLWRQKDLGRYNHRFTAKVGRHGVVMVRIR